MSFVSKRYQSHHSLKVVSSPSYGQGGSVLADNGGRAV